MSEAQTADPIPEAPADEAALEEGNGWFKLFGDSRLGACATDGCGGQPTWRLEAGGVGSNYCSGCSARIRALSASPLTEEQPVGEAGPMPGTTGFTMAAFKAADVPVGTKLYVAPVPHTARPIDTDDQVEELAKECGINNRRFMTPGDYSIWCRQQRQFARLAALPRSTTGGAK